MAALIYNSQTASPPTKRLRTRAEQASIPVVTMTETLPKGQDYLHWMGAQISQLHKATAAQ